MTIDLQINLEQKLSDILSELAYPPGERPIFSVHEMAVIAGIADATMYAKIRVSEKLTALEYIKLALAYAEKGEYGLLKLAIPEGQRVIHYECTCTPDGNLAAEYMENTEVLGALGKAFKKQDKKTALRLLPHAKINFAKIEKEVEAMS